MVSLGSLLQGGLVPEQLFYLFLQSLDLGLEHFLLHEVVPNLHLLLLQIA